MRALILLLLAMFTLPGTGRAALADLTVGEPPTVYFQWLNSPSDPMTQADGDGMVSLLPFTGGALMQLLSPPVQELYLGVMCNRDTGYDVFLTASQVGAGANIAELTIVGGNPMSVTVGIIEESGTFDGGATTSVSLDLSGATASATAAYQNSSQCPLTAAAPNVWKVTLQMPSISTISDGLLMSGTYQGSLTATVSLK